MISDWDNFFVAEVGASAALAGLVFVAVSINLSRILQLQQLPARAAEALAILLSVLFVSSCGLVPGQSATAFGAEVLFISGFLWVCLTVSFLRHRKVYGKAFIYYRITFSQLPPLPFMAGAVLLLCGRANGMHLVVAGILLSFAIGVLDAWVLLVEILR
ncbi:MAG TPA: hypothetical protein VHC69_32600 [Polyangiaceae bacterium]|nr:hypothetical protein [Polyangiaceae bacterium]